MLRHRSGYLYGLRRQVSSMRLLAMELNIDCARTLNTKYSWKRGNFNG